MNHVGDGARTRSRRVREVRRGPCPPTRRDPRHPCGRCAVCGRGRRDLRSQHGFGTARLVGLPPPAAGRRAACLTPRRSDRGPGERANRVTVRDAWPARMPTAVPGAGTGPVHGRSRDGARGHGSGPRRVLAGGRDRRPARPAAGARPPEPGRRPRGSPHPGSMGRPALPARQAPGPCARSPGCRRDGRRAAWAGRLTRGRGDPASAGSGRARCGTRPRRYGN